MVTLHGNLDAGLGYDQNGNVTSVTPPGKPAHAQQYTDVDLLWKHVSPEVLGATATTQWDYDKDRRASQLTRADQATAVATWESATGRLGSVHTTIGDYIPGYDATSGRLKSWTAPGPITTTAGFDGPLLTSVKTKWGALLEREVSWTTDALLRPGGGRPVSTSCGYDAAGFGGTHIIFDLLHLLDFNNNGGLNSDDATEGLDIIVPGPWFKFPRPDNTA